LLSVFADEHPRALFVEVGSNDGLQHDPLRPFIVDREWRGIMVEPVPYVFERLRRTYEANPRIAIENVAIADRDASLPFYYLREAALDERAVLPGWYDGIGSFSLQTVLSHSRHIPDIEHRVIAGEVPCLTFESLCEKHGVQQLDLLLIDTEGYDREVLRGIDLERWSPRLLVFEHYHLSPGDRSACTAQLAEAGYELLSEGFDTWCLGPRATDRVRAQWRRLRPAVPAAFAANEPT
jgi:FkbM family methyltransferase